MVTARKYRNRASKLVILSIGSRREGNAFDLPVRARSATVLSLRPLCFSVEPSRSAGERDGLQIKGIAQNSCRARFDAHSKRGTESSNPTLGSFGRSKKRQRFCHARRSDKWVLSPVLSPGRACSRHRGRHDKRHAKNATVRVTHRVSEGSYDSRCLGEPEISRAKYHRRRLSCSRTATWGWPSVRLVNPRLCLPHEYLLAFWRKAAT